MITFFLCVNGVALVELLNSLESRSSELAMDVYFIFMVRTTTRKAGKPRFYCCASFLRRFKIICQDKVNFNNLLTFSWLFYSLQMNSLFFLVTASTVFYAVPSGKFSSGRWTWMVCICNVLQNAKKIKRQQQQQKNNAFWTLPIIGNS